MTTEDTENTEAATPETDAAERMAFAQEYMVPTDFARKLERERDESRDAIRALAEHGESEIQRITKERDEARVKMADALQDVDLRTLDFERMKQERDEARRVSRKFLKEVLQLIDSQDWKGFMESRETARRLLEGWQ